MLNGKKINPRRLSQLSGKPLAKAQMPAFAKRRTEIDFLRGASEIITAKPATAVMTASAPK
jgi:hypothetical protein